MRSRSTRRPTRREFLEHTMLAAAAASAPPWAARALGQDSPAATPDVTPRPDAIRLGVVGVRGRGRGHVAEFKRSPDARVVAICDADEGVIDLAMKAVPEATYVKDIRKLLDDPRVDAISIATPNHWHALATIWALQAGKHVYVEKPISHDVAEGRQVVEAANRSGLLVQHGTQARSQRATREAIAWLREGGLGRIHLARALCYKRRESIGKVEGPQPVPATLDYDLWTGPAEMTPLLRRNLHYDWHWVFNTGNGDIGNQGVHQMDIARWGLGRETLPARVRSLGGRLGYDDDGNTPNTLISVFDWDDGPADAPPVIFEVRGLETTPYRTAHIGVIFHCEHGYLVSASYAKVLAFDHDGNEIRAFTGGSDGDHFQNFLDAIRSGRAGDLNADGREGHLSSAMCHLGNISCRLGAPRTLSSSEEPFGRDDADESFGRVREHLVENGLDPEGTTYALGPELTFDAGAERFTGAHAEPANALLSRPGRAPFVA